MLILLKNRNLTLRNAVNSLKSVLNICINAYLTHFCTTETKRGNKMTCENVPEA